MENDEKKDAVAIKYEYSLEMLLNDIQDNQDENAAETDSNERAEREYQHKLVVMQMLIYFAILYKSEEYSEDEKLANSIEVKVNNDELLSGYLFYASQNPQFDYTWNYMRKRKKDYCKFLVETVRFLNNVITDINILAGKTHVGTDIHVVFDDVFDVSLVNEKPFVKANALWENFYRVASLKREYNICVKVKESLLVASFRKKSSDADNLIDAALDKVKGMMVESEPKS